MGARDSDKGKKQRNAVGSANGGRRRVQAKAAQAPPNSEYVAEDTPEPIGRRSGLRRTGRPARQTAGTASRIAEGDPDGTDKHPTAVPMCSASTMSRNKKQTCFSYEELKDLSLAYNRSVGGDKIAVQGASADELLAALKERLGRVCDTERCWLNIGLLPGDVEKKLDLNFAPLKPPAWKSNPTEWLSNHDIEEALTRHTARHDDFSLLGVFPMDFMDNDASGKCVSSLCDFRIIDLVRKGKRRAAIVLNTDKHTQGGQHWVCVFIHASPHDSRYGVYFFDSTGRGPTTEVDEFATDVVDQLKEAFGVTPEPLYSYNDTSAQKQNTECGIFCVHFVMKMLGGCGFRKVCSTIGDDVKMIKLRSRLFADQ